MKKSLSFLLLLTFLMGVYAYAQDEQRVEQVVNKILNGQLVNAYVRVHGVIIKWNHNPANNTIAYVIQDDWGDQITVISNAAHPETNKRHLVEGYVTYQNATKEYQIMEHKRFNLEIPTPAPTAVPTFTPVPTATPLPPEPTATPTPVPQGLFMNEKGAPDYTLIALIGAVVVVLLLLVVLLFRNRRTASPMDFDATAVITVADKTQKISAPVASAEAVQAGTVKVMPGRFEIAGGVDLKEIRLIRPPKVAEHQVEYTFGRLPGDRITHIQLNDPTVSSRQARLRFREGKYCLVNVPDPADPDRNATVLNGQKMNADESIQLKEGDTIIMGHVSLIYHEK